MGSPPRRATRLVKKTWLSLADACAYMCLVGQNDRTEAAKSADGHGHRCLPYAPARTVGPSKEGGDTDAPGLRSHHPPLSRGWPRDSRAQHLDEVLRNLTQRTAV